MIINISNKFNILYFSHDHRYLCSDRMELQIYNIQAYRVKMNKEKSVTKQLNIDVETAETTPTITISSTSAVTKQTNLSGFVSWPLSNKDNFHFENLLLLMMVSNGLSFSFLENKETHDLFQF